MNERIRRYFDEIEDRLIESPAILSYQIIGKDISLDDGKLRLRSALPLITPNCPMRLTIYTSVQIKLKVFQECRTFFRSSKKSKGT